jgi:hypothetical protein
MNVSFTKLCITTTLGMLMLSACTVAKLESRLEANPQCKDVINPKTGAVMPCPGTDKSFYRSVGLEPPRATTTSSTTAAAAPPTSSNAGTAATPIATTTTKSTPTVQVTPQVDCKPQLHKKTGGMLPCPSPD